MKKRKLIFLALLFPFLASCDVSGSLNNEAFLSKLIPNWISFVAQLGALIVLIIVVIIFAYKPVKKILKKRQDYVESNIKDAEESKAKWQENELKSKETVLASSRTAANIVADAKEQANIERQKILDDTALEVDQMKKNAENDIARMESEAQDKIKKEMVSVALDASKELLGREVSSSDNTRLLEEFIEDVKKK